MGWATWGPSPGTLRQVSGVKQHITNSIALILPKNKKPETQASPEIELELPQSSCKSTLCSQQPKLWACFLGFGRCGFLLFFPKDIIPFAFYLTEILPNLNSSGCTFFMFQYSHDILFSSFLLMNFISNAILS